MEQFKWQLATLEELVEKFESDTKTFGQQQYYYRQSGNAVMSEKMVKAKKLALIKRLQESI